MPELCEHPEIPVDAAGVITLVSGLPRSGTSLMMQILEAAGLAPHTDGHRTPDASNETGYYEHDRVGTLLGPGDKSWLAEARGRALKVVAPLLGALPLRLGAGEPLHYRLFFMERSMDELLDSQRVMLERLGKSVPEGGDVGKAYLQQVRHARAWAVRHRVPGMCVNYQDLVHRPDTVLPKVAAFLGVEENLPAMQACIDPSLHRSRGGK
jgi:hypothetical protein